MILFSSLRNRSLSSLTRYISSAYSTTTTNKVPLLYEPKTDVSDLKTTTYQLLSWGRGASGQLGGGVEEIRLYPTPVANIILPSSSFAFCPTPGRLPIPNSSNKDNNARGDGKVEVDICCGLFHSSLLVDGKLWIWGKGDGGRLGFGHENSVFIPTVNPHLESVQSVALGGLHSVALTSLGQVFTWSVH